jgi:HEAT repeat protein
MARVSLAAGRACLVALITLASSGVRAAEPKPPVPPLKVLRAELSSGDEARVLRALEGLGSRRQKGSVEALVAFVHTGQPDRLADRAVEALGQLASPAALPLVTEMAGHRRAGARVTALTAAAELEGSAVDALLTNGLRDSDATVRGTCARLLGERGTRSAVDLLFRALERGVPEAAPAIGRLGDSAAVTRMHGLLGKLALHPLLAGYDRFLARSDLDEATKLDIVTHLGEVASLAVKRFLEQQLQPRAAGVAARSPRLTAALRETAKRIPEQPTSHGEPAR